MTIEIFDPLAAREAVQEARAVTGQPPARDVAGVPKKRPTAPLKASTSLSSVPDEDPLKKDFRLFVILLWRHLNLPDPTPIQLSIAWFLQHGPERSIIMAFRGAAKSWLTGAYVLWLLYCDPQKKVLVVSGSLKRAAAFTNFCLSVIRDMPLLQFLAPRQHQKQSAVAFEVGPALPDQSPSFHAAGIAGQIVGFRADIIIPDDVETQTNSLTVTMREKVAEAIKEFDSILKPGGAIKFLGTPHDEDSLYTKLLQRGYTCRIWPVLFPDQDQIKGYGDRLAPYILECLRKDASLVGTSVEPTRFTNDDLAKRRLSIGNSEFALQFMLDTSLSDRDKYPLKVRDLIVLPLDSVRGPESLVWSNDASKRLLHLPVLGFEGDYYHSPIMAEDERYARYSSIVGGIDNSGRGADETSLSIVAELYGMVFWLHLWAGTAGYDQPTLQAIASACVRFRVQTLYVESNFGDGMFVALLRPVLDAAWKRFNRDKRDDQRGGTQIEEVRSGNKTHKEKRILSVLEPITQQHRLVVNQEIIEWDYGSLKKIDGEDTRHRYAWGHQFTHLTREADSLIHDDRLESLSIALAPLAPILGVDPIGMSIRAQDDRADEELEKLFEDADEIGGHHVNTKSNWRPIGLQPQGR